MFENQENNLETEKSLTINMKGEKGNLLPHLKVHLGRHCCWALYHI